MPLQLLPTRKSRSSRVQLGGERQFLKLCRPHTCFPTVLGKQEVADKSNIVSKLTLETNGLIASDRSSTGSNLAIIPAAMLPAYSASKAALNAFVLCLRDQLSGTNVNVIELSPPPVQSKSRRRQSKELADQL
jgi:NAD(P)-dependent dehydrogenase (short-subunit alcohol dehydrogenase family)